MKLAVPSLCVKGHVVQGTQAASGKSYLSEYGGTIALQRKFFEHTALDFSALHNGTINVDITPFIFTVQEPCCEVKEVKWHPDKTEVSETFWFLECTLEFRNKVYAGYLYYPHPATKIGKFPGHHVMEILAPFVEEMTYGETVLLYFPHGKISCVRAFDP